MSNRETIIRTCTVCQQPYLGGTYPQHRRGHRPRVTENQSRVLDLLAQGHSQSEAARMLGVTRQYVNGIARATKGENAA